MPESRPPALPRGSHPRLRRARLRHRECRRRLRKLCRFWWKHPQCDPLPAGEVADPVAVGDDRLEELIREATRPAEDVETVLWHDAGSEVLAHLGRTRVRVLDGLVVVAVTLECDQTGVAEVTVPFVVGREDRLAGMVVATEDKPRGPDVLVDRWGEAVIAVAWEALLEIADAVAGESGSDESGERLRAGALVAERGRLQVVPQARHDFELEGQSRRPRRERR